MTMTAVQKANHGQTKVDYYSVKWRGPDVYSEDHRYYRETEKYGHRKFHTRDFKSNRSAMSWARKISSTEGVDEVSLHPIQIVGKEFGFPMAFVGDKLPF